MHWTGNEIGPEGAKAIANWLRVFNGSLNKLYLGGEKTHFWSFIHNTCADFCYNIIFDMFVVVCLGQGTTLEMRGRRPSRGPWQCSRAAEHRVTKSDNVIKIINVTKS